MFMYGENMIKLIGIDCDDTILNTNKEISDCDALMIKKASTLKNIKCVLTTGRPFVKKTIEYYKKLGIYEENQYFIAYNGAAIYNVYTKELLFSTTLNGKDIKEIHNIVNEYNVSHYIHKTGCICYDTLNEYSYLEKKFNDIDLYTIDFDKISDNEVAFKYMLGGNPKLIKEIFLSIPQDIKQKYNVVISMPCFLEFMDKRVNKWSGLVELAKRLDIKDDEIMAIGDSMNDYEMIKNSKIGVAMENALPKIIEIADYVTSNNDNSGVGKAIKKIIF